MNKKKESKEKGVLKKEISLGRIKFSDKVIFAKHMSVMIESGLDITEALEIGLQESRAPMRKVLRSILKSVESGQSFADSLALHPKVFDNSFTQIIRAGERSGSLGKNLNNLSEQLKKESELVSKITSAFVYPLVVFVAAFFLAVVFSFYILPQIIPLFESLEIDLPLSTRVLIWFTHFMEKNGLWVVLGLIGFVIFYVRISKFSILRPFNHWFFLHTPILKSVVKFRNMTKFNRLFGTMIQSGLRVDEALDITSESMGNFYYRRALKKVSVDIKSGRKLAENLGRYDKLFSILMTNMIAVGEESGRLEEILLYLADFYELEVDKALKNFTTALEPVLLILIGSVVAGLAISIIKPIYQITGSF